MVSRKVVFGIIMILMCAGCAGVTGAQDPGLEGEQQDISVTVYNNDLGVVRESRRLEIESGTHIVRFRGVPSRLDPTSVHLKATDGQALEVLEQNYRYDLVNSEKILERYLDSEIRVILEEGRLYEGTLLSFSGGRLVLGGAGESDDEGLVILSQDKITDLQFPALPEGLITRPTLEWMLVSDRGGQREIEVSYMTSGMDWHAEYVAVVAADDRTLDLSGWVSVNNQSGATYANADLQLVAGDVHRVPRERRLGGNGRVRHLAAEAPQAKGFEEETFFEYHLYSLGRRTTLRDKETKQLALFSPAESEVKKLYESNPGRDNKKVRVVLEMVNSEETGLGMPLPKGKVRVYKRDRRDRLQFVGEDQIDHTPRDEKIRIFVGSAFDLVVERTEMDQRKIGPRTREVDVKIEVRNRKTDEDVVVIVQENLYGDWRIMETSHEYEKKSARKIEFPVAVRAGEVETVTFTVRYSY